MGNQRWKNSIRLTQNGKIQTYNEEPLEVDSDVVAARAGMRYLAFTERDRAGLICSVELGLVAAPPTWGGTTLLVLSERGGAGRTYSASNSECDSTMRHTHHGVSHSLCIGCCYQGGNHV